VAIDAPIPSRPSPEPRTQPPVRLRLNAPGWRGTAERRAQALPTPTSLPASQAVAALFERNAERPDAARLYDKAAGLRPGKPPKPGHRSLPPASSRPTDSEGNERRADSPLEQARQAEQQAEAKAVFPQHGEKPDPDLPGEGDEKQPFESVPLLGSGGEPPELPVLGGREPPDSEAERLAEERAKAVRWRHDVTRYLEELEAALREPLPDTLMPAGPQLVLLLRDARAQAGHPLSTDFAVGLGIEALARDADERFPDFDTDRLYDAGMAAYRRAREAEEASPTLSLQA